jgi:CHAT domain-containing protein
MELVQKIKLLCLTIVLLESYVITAASVFAKTAVGQISQQMAPNTTRSSARAIFLEAMQLYQQKTAESLKQAIPKFQEASRLFEAEGDRRQRARAFNQIGKIYVALGEKQKALQYFEQALALRRAINDPTEIGYSLINIGGVYAGLGQYPKGLEYYNQSLHLGKSANNRALTAKALSLMCEIYNTLEENQKALEYCDRSLQLSQAVDDRALAARTLTTLGRAHHALGDSPRALEYLDRSLLLSQALNNRSEEARTLTNIGRIYHALGENQKALEYFNRSLLLSRFIDNRTQKARTLASMATALRDQGQLREALDYIQAATQIFDNLYYAIDNRDLKIQYFSTIQYYYQLEIDLLMQLHRQSPTPGYDRLAFEVSERARARSLLQLLSESNIDLKLKKNSSLVTQERQILQSLKLLERQRSQLLDVNYSPTQVEELNQRSDRLVQQLKNLAVPLRAENPAYASLKYPQPLTLPQIQQQILDTNTILLEYSLGPKRSYLWAVTKTKFFSYELPNSSKINATVNAYRTFLTNPSLSDRLQAVFQASLPVSQMLLKPVMSELGKKRLLVVTDGALQYLPFAALVHPSQTIGTTHAKQTNPFLLAEHEIVNIPSASTLAVLRDKQTPHKPAAKSIAIFADPVFSQNDERIPNNKVLDRPQNVSPNLNALPTSIQTLRSPAKFERLRGTRQEAEQILKFIPEERNRFQAFDFNANKVNATRPDLNQYRILHFATHGIFDSLRPELSRIVLSTIDQQGNYQDGSLTLYDIFNLNLSSELVVLSACQTGLGQNIRGEGLVGLTRGFMYAGSPRVLVSLWSVNDESTADLMTRFYKVTLEQNLSPAAALRAAQIEMLQQPKWQSPYYWAAFTLQGEWK